MSGPEDELNLIAAFRHGSGSWKASVSAIARSVL